MNVVITPGKLGGTIEAVTSKSDLHRLCICAALAERPTKIYYNAASEDIEATLSCLDSLGAKCIQENGYIIVVPIGQATVSADLDCKESGSTLRFLLPVAAVYAEESSFYGSARLAERPLDPLLSEMKQNGGTYHQRTAGKETEPIVTITGKLTSGTFRLPGNVSSQFISGLLFALPLLAEDSVIELTSPLQSRGYVEMTRKTQQCFGVESIWKDDQTLSICGGQRYLSPGVIAAERDWSNAAFWLAANYLGSNVTLNGLAKESTQGDRAIVELLEELKRADEKVTIDASQIPDLVPILAVAAAAAPVTTEIINASRLRMKESDRLAAITQNLKVLGADITEHESGLTIRGQNKLGGGIVNGCNDHRIVMAMAIAGTICQDPVMIRGAQAVQKSYPDFFTDFQFLGGECHVV